MNQARMKESPVVQLEAPRFENGKRLLVAGLRSRYTAETMNNIPAQWQRFAPHIGKIPRQVGGAAYGVCLNASNCAEGVDYLSGVEVSSSSGLFSEFSVATIAAQRYAVFPHREHVSKLRDTLDAISHWLPESGHEAAHGAAGAPDFFERYSEEFDPRTGMGGVEVWIPVKGVKRRKEHFAVTKNRSTHCFCVPRSMYK
jgi:AraC family transcriptional regulator